MPKKKKEPGDDKKKLQEFIDIFNGDIEKILSEKLEQTILSMSISKKDIVSSIFKDCNEFKDVMCKPIFCCFSLAPFERQGAIDKTKDFFKQAGEKDDPILNKLVDLHKDKKFVYCAYGIRLFKDNIEYVKAMGFYEFVQYGKDSYLPLRPLELITEYEEEVPYFIESMNSLLPKDTKKYVFVPDNQSRNEYGLMPISEYFAQARIVLGAAISRW